MNWNREKIDSLNWNLVDNSDYPKATKKNIENFFNQPKNNLDKFMHHFYSCILHQSTIFDPFGPLFDLFSDNLAFLENIFHDELILNKFFEMVQEIKHSLDMYIEVLPNPFPKINTEIFMHYVSSDQTDELFEDTDAANAFYYYCVVRAHKGLKAFKNKLQDSNEECPLVTKVFKDVVKHSFLDMPYR